MTLQLRCGEVITGCDGVVNGSTQNEVLDAAAVHAADAHDLTTIDPDTQAALTAATHPV